MSQNPEKLIPNEPKIWKAKISNGPKSWKIPNRSKSPNLKSWKLKSRTGRKLGKLKSWMGKIPKSRNIEFVKIQNGLKFRILKYHSYSHDCTFTCWRQREISCVLGNYPHISIRMISPLTGFWPFRILDFKFCVFGISTEKTTLNIKCFKVINYTLEWFY